MSTIAIDNSTSVAEALTTLQEHDPAAADREELGKLMQLARKVRGYLDGYDIACARRGRELNAQGQSESAFGLFLGSGCGSGKEAHAAEVREGVCAELPEFEEALAAGDVSTHHLDALGRQTRNLTDDERLDLKEQTDELLDHATNQTAETFEKNLKAVITRIKDRYKPDSDVEELERQRRNSNVSTWVDRATGMRKTLIELDPIRHEQWWRVFDAQLARLKAEAGSKDKTWQELKVEAFLATAEPGGDPRQAGEPLEHHASPERRPARVPQVTVLIDLETLLRGRHASTIAELTDGTPIPLATIRQMLCDADIIPAVLGGRGEVLDLGRSRRLADRAQREALRAMFRTCIDPGCTVPSDQCHMHHVTPWEQGGRSDLANFAPLCPEAHQKVHSLGWSLSMTGPDEITWTRPDGTISYQGPAPNRRQAGRPADRR